MNDICWVMYSEYFCPAVFSSLLSLSATMTYLVLILYMLVMHPDFSMQCWYSFYLAIQFILQREWCMISWKSIFVGICHSVVLVICSCWNAFRHLWSSFEVKLMTIVVNCENGYIFISPWTSDFSHCVSGAYHGYWWPFTLIIDNQSVESSVPVVSRWLWPENRTFWEVASTVVTWWIVAFLPHIKRQRSPLSHVDHLESNYVFMCFMQSEMKYLWTMFPCSIIFSVCLSCQ